MSCVEDAVAPSPYWCERCRADSCEDEGAQNAADDVEFLDFGGEKVRLDEEVKIEGRMKLEQEDNNPAEELVVDVQGFVRAASEKLDG